MIRVTAMLDVHGQGQRFEKLCDVEIVNDGTGTKTRRNYDVTLYSRGSTVRVVKRARVENFPSTAVAAWHLVAAAFRALEDV